MIDLAQILLAFFSALFGAGLGGAVRWSGSRRERLLKLTIDLYAEWHTPAFTHVRITAHEALSRAKNLPDAYVTLQGEEREAVASVVHFWERVAVLLKSGAVEEALLRRFFGQYARWWNELLCERDPATLDDPEWGQTLRDVRWLFNRLIKSRRLGARR
jgi:hypothetical protein